MISKKRKKYFVMQEVAEKISNSIKNTEEFDDYGLPFSECSESLLKVEK